MLDRGLYNRRAGLLTGLLVCLAIARLPALPALLHVVPSTAGSGDQVLVAGEAFGPYVRPEDAGLPDDCQQADGASRVILVNIGTAARRFVHNCRVLSWEDSRVVFSLPEDLLVDKPIGQDGFQVSDTLLFFSSQDSVPLKLPYLVGESAKPEIDNLQVVNITTTSAEVLWCSTGERNDSLVLALGGLDTLDITSSYFSGERNYYPGFVVKSGQPSRQPSSVRIFHSDLSLGNGVRRIVLTDLQPGTLYKFFLGLSGGLFLADSARLVGGPYNPLPVGRTDDNRNSLLDAFAFRTVSGSGPGESGYLLTGSVKTPVIGGRVSVFLVSAAQPQDTSTTTGTMFDSQGRWLVNLNSLRQADQPSSRFQPSAGDIVCVAIDAGDQGFSRFESRLGPPGTKIQNLGSRELHPVVNFPELICIGNNLISVPVINSEDQPLTAVALLDKFPGGKAGLSRYSTDQGTFQTCYRSGMPGPRYLGENFPLRPGEAYLLSSSQNTDIIWRGAMFGSDLPEIVFPGAGIFYFSRPLQPDSLTVDWDAFSFLQQVPGAREIYTWDSRYQRYLSAFKLPWGEIRGLPFALRPGGGYIARITEESSWNISLPAGMLLAGAATPPQADPGNYQYPAARACNWERLAWSGGAILSDLTASSFSLLTGNLRLTYENLELPPGASVEVIDRAGYSLIVCSGLPPGFELNSERIPRGLPRGKRANINNQKISTIEDSPQLAAGSLQFRLPDLGGADIRLPRSTMLQRPDMICYGSLTGEKDRPLAEKPLWIGPAGSDLSAGKGLLVFSDRQGGWWVNLANFPQGLAEMTAGGDSVSLQIVALTGNDLLQAEARLQDGFPARLDLKLEQPARESPAHTRNAPGKNLPRVFSLEQNHPNPFNPQTSIGFTIAASTVNTTPVCLQIFDLRGRKVATLVKRSLAAGRYGVAWNGLDDHGRPQGSGVYLYRLSLPETTLTRKMILLK
ncbi:MAG: T9SS type A sorting domain-containing protein [Candidatus Glassbacteria bacterium]|nr:T9SS type A sorting domain-containing protein [Candidatus Glassbacteria bacterium]